MREANEDNELYVMMVLDVSRLVGRLRDTFSQCREQYNFARDACEETVDWCVAEIVKEALSEVGTRVMHHYSYDEGKVLYSEFRNEYPVDSQIKFFSDVFSRKQVAKGTAAKMMVMGDALVIGFKTR